MKTFRNALTPLLYFQHLIGREHTRQPDLPGRLALPRLDLWHMDDLDTFCQKHNSHRFLLLVPAWQWRLARPFWLAGLLYCLPVWSLMALMLDMTHLIVITVRLRLNHRPVCPSAWLADNWPSYLLPVTLNGFQGNHKFLHTGLSLAICQSRDSVPTVPCFLDRFYLTIYVQYRS